VTVRPNRAGLTRVLMAVAATFRAFRRFLCTGQGRWAADKSRRARDRCGSPASRTPRPAADSQRFQDGHHGLDADAAKTAAPSRQPGARSEACRNRHARRNPNHRSVRSETPNSDTATTTPATPCDATAPAPEPAKEPVKAASKRARGDQPVADKLREKCSAAKSLRVFDRKASAPPVEKF